MAGPPARRVRLPAETLGAEVPATPGCAIVGVFWGAFTIHEPAENAKNMEQLLQLYSAGKLKPIVNANAGVKR